MNWVERVVYDDVRYCHGEGGTARTKGKNDMMSTVQGHIHTQAYTEWIVGRKFRIFSLQVGCGIDSSAYAAAYAKHFKKQAIGCGVVLEGTYSNLAIINHSPSWTKVFSFPNGNITRGESVW